MCPCVHLPRVNGVIVVIAVGRGSAVLLHACGTEEKEVQPAELSQRRLEGWNLVAIQIRNPD